MDCRTIYPTVKGMRSAFMSNQNSSSILVSISFVGALLLFVSLGLVNDNGRAQGRTAAHGIKPLHFEFAAREFYDR